MKIAVTGGTGFIGRYILKDLISSGHSVRAWHRPESDLSGLPSEIEWLYGDLGDREAGRKLIEGSDVVVHGALYRPNRGFRRAEGDLTKYLEKNVIGSIQLIEDAYNLKIPKFIFISTCAVHEKVLDDRRLDENHPDWPASHYGAHKAAIEKFMFSFALGYNYNICALRPTGVYGLAHRPEYSKWYELIKSIAEERDVEVSHGGKEVHVSDVAKSVSVLLGARDTIGQTYNCYDMYISEFRVAQIVKELTNSKSIIYGKEITPKNQIITEKIRSLGMEFGGESLLRSSLREVISNI